MTSRRLTAADAMSFESEPGELTYGEEMDTPGSEACEAARESAQAFMEPHRATIAAVAPMVAAARTYAPLAPLLLAPTCADLARTIANLARPIEHARVFAPVLRHAAAFASVLRQEAAARKRHRSTLTRGCQRRARPRSRRPSTAARRAAGIRAGTDPGDPEPPRPARRALAAALSAHEREAVIA